MTSRTPSTTNTKPLLLSFDSDVCVSGCVNVSLQNLTITRMLVQGSSGSGKSWALRFLLEQTHGQIQQFVFDPEGEFSTLREHFPYVLVGAEGDLAADPERAGVLCRRLMELQASAIFDLYDLSLAERRRFVRVFLEELINLPRSLWNPLLVVIDEAHLFAPERSSGEAESTDAVIALATRGRKRPFALVLATQRIAKLHKDAAADLLNKLIGRTDLDLDVLRAAGHLGFNKLRRLELPQLRPGTFYAYGPAVSTQPVLVQTGAVRTTHPAPGAIVPPAPPPPAAIRELLAQLVDLPTPESLANDELKQARLRIAQLERQLAEGQQVPKIERVIEHVVTDDQLRNLTQIAAQLAATSEQAGQVATLIHDAIESTRSTTAGSVVENGSDSNTLQADWEQMLQLPAVVAKIAQAEAILPADSAGYIRRILGVCLSTAFSPDEIVEAWGLRGKSSFQRVRRACEALLGMRLLIDDTSDRLTVNREELRRLARLAALVGRSN